MKRLDKLKRELRKLKGNIVLASTPGYQGFFEEFSKNVWRLNIFVDMNEVSLRDFLKIKDIVSKIYYEYNLIISAERKGTMEYWHGEYKNSKNLLLHLVPITSSMIRKYITESANFINREVIVGNDFVKGIVNQDYDWLDFSIVASHVRVVNFIYLTEGIGKEFKLGMLKAFFLKFITSSIYCKGAIPKNRNKIERFFKERFNDKKMLKIIGNFYDNKYRDMEKATSEVLYFTKKVMDWPGLRID